MNSKQGGFALIELMGALAIGALLLIGLAALTDSSLDDMKGQQASYYQSQVVEAARKYISANANTLQTSAATSTTVIPVTIADLKTGQFLPSSFSAANVYGQATCALIRQPNPTTYPGQFDTLIVTTGGSKIPDKDIAVVAANAGSGGGYISTTSPTTAHGSSWSLATDQYRSATCGSRKLDGTAADGGHLASSLFSDSPGQYASDFLYRNAVAGHPELNRMNTPVRMAQSALVVTGAACGTDAGIAIDIASRALLTCSAAGKWSAPAAGTWKDPVASYAALPAVGNSLGDVRLATDLNRAFAYNGTQWIALAVDQNGNLSAPGTITAGAVTATNDITGRDLIANRNLTVTGNGLVKGDVHVNGDVDIDGDLTAENVYGRDGVLGLSYMQTPEIEVDTVMSAGMACNYIHTDSNGKNEIWYPWGTIVMDTNRVPLICNKATSTYKYANGTNSP